MKTNTIGGSLLASSSPAVFEPVACRDGTLQVVEDRAADTHHLLLNERVIASHPNGFSCRALALALASGDPARVLRQAVYIVQCGGQVRADRIGELLATGSPCTP